MKRKKLEQLIEQAYIEVLQEHKPTIYESVDKDKYPPSFLKSIEKKYGPIDYEHDRFSDDLGTYLKTTEVRKDGVDHDVIKLPSFAKLYEDFSDIILDVRHLMRNKDVRSDKAARELFELIKTNYRALQRYLREERPEQYDMMKSLRSFEEVKLFEQFVSESLYDEMNEQEPEEEPQPEETPDMDAPKDTELADATDTILAKFPTLKAALVKLQTEDFKDFVSSIDWVSPRPTSFRINLKNGQDYILKWMGNGFQAQIMGKRFFINNISDYQQALDKLEILYREAPFKTAQAEGEGADDDFGSADTGGGDFPGGDATGGGGEEPAGDIGGDEEGGADLSGEPVDFEAGEEG